MRKTIFLIITLSISTFCFSQKTQSIKWKNGESKNITMNLHSRIIADSTNPIDSVLTTKSKLTVEDVHNENYIIKLNTYNQLINFGLLYYPDLLEKLKDMESLSSYFKVNKDSLSYEFLNRAEYEKTLKTMYDTIIQIFDTSSIEGYDTVKVELNQLYNSLKEKSEAMHVLDFLIETYGTKYFKKDTLFRTDSIVSPLNGDRYLTTNEKTYVEKKTKNIYEISVDKTCVFNAQKDLLPDIKKQIERMFKTMSEDADTTELTHQMQTMINSFVDSYEFEGSELFKITKNKKSNWPTKISKEANFDINNLGNKSKIIIGISIEIN